jgi:uncharacterized protein (TIGR00730 family)
MKNPSFYFKEYGSLLKSMGQLMKSIWVLRGLPQPAVTIFGGSRLQQSSPYAHLAHEVADKLVKNDISVITGGGPGIMEAANCGARHSVDGPCDIRSIGIAVKGLDNESLNIYAQRQLVVDHFWARKWLMVRYAVSFVIFPGGFGTIDEMAEVATLMQTKKLTGIPIVLMGKEYWEPFLQWLEMTVLKEGLISQADLDMIYVTDNVHEAVALIRERCLECEQ